MLDLAVNTEPATFKSTSQNDSDGDTAMGDAEEPAPEGIDESESGQGEQSEPGVDDRSVGGAETSKS